MTEYRLTEEGELMPEAELSSTKQGALIQKLSQHPHSREFIEEYEQSRRFPETKQSAEALMADVVGGCRFISGNIKDEDVPKKLGWFESSDNRAKYNGWSSLFRTYAERDYPVYSGTVSLDEDCRIYQDSASVRKDIVTFQSRILSGISQFKLTENRGFIGGYYHLVTLVPLDLEGEIKKNISEKYGLEPANKRNSDIFVDFFSQGPVVQQVLKFVSSGNEAATLADLLPPKGTPEGLQARRKLAELIFDTYEQERGLLRRGRGTQKGKEFDLESVEAVLVNYEGVPLESVARNLKLYRASSEGSFMSLERVARAFGASEVLRQEIDNSDYIASVRRHQAMMQRPKDIGYRLATDANLKAFVEGRIILNDLENGVKKEEVPKYLYLRMNEVLNRVFSFSPLNKDEVLYNINDEIRKIIVKETHREGLGTEKLIEFRDWVGRTLYGEREYEEYRVRLNEDLGIKETPKQSPIETPEEFNEKLEELLFNLAGVGKRIESLDPSQLTIDELLREIEKLREGYPDIIEQASTLRGSLLPSSEEEK